ncbi:uncharacterized protein SAPINGB_P004378 [Magnusiomyces paraingens]|uniref:ACB domain-containing protein n=1 Tax=Magnusiomyces paraingens TaxID=2606893 RepID=A0A5E8BTI5_9ASCO|nr:uncharacterized protein SAPINGB_P004378 [Saprochaete ingens]VVT55018.1 unnamed protein product [Saprochaete ingens]
MPSQEFLNAVDKVNKLTKRPSDDELLELYGLYKQATIGDNETPKPAIYDLKGKYKWNAWNELQGTSQEEAEKKYIELVEKISARLAAE